MTAEEMQKKLDEQKAQIEKAEAEVKAQAEAQAAELAKANEELEKAKAEAAELAKAAEDAKSDDDVAKAAKAEAEELKKRLDAAETTLAETNAALAKAADDKLEQDFIAKAAALGNLPVKSDVLGPILKGISVGKSSEEDQAKLMELFKAADAAFGQLFKSTGNNNVPDANSAEEQLTKIAKGLQEADGSTYEAAYTKALEQNPALYSQHMQSLS